MQQLMIARRVYVYEEVFGNKNLVNISVTRIFEMVNMFFNLKREHLINRHPTLENLKFVLVSAHDRIMSSILKAFMNH